MIRIVGIQRNECPDLEFVLFQNQGTLRETLRGHVVMSEEALEQCDMMTYSHVFKEDEQVPSGMYVILYSGKGTPRWARTKDNALVYFAYMGRGRSVWNDCIGPIHLLGRQHSFANRREMVLAS